MKKKIFELVQTPSFDLARGIIFVLLGVFIIVYMITFKENNKVNILPLILYLFSIIIFFPDIIREFIKEEKST